MNILKLKTGLILGLATIFLSGCAGTKVTASRPPAPTVKQQEKEGVCIGDETGARKVMCLRAEEFAAEERAKVARIELVKLATPAEKLAMKEMRGSEKDSEQIRRREAQVQAQAKIEGCEPGSVWVNPNLVVTNLLPGVLRAFTVAPYVVVRFYNPRANGEPVDIEASDYGLVVKNLCVGGRVSVYRQFRYGYDAQYVRYAYKVIGLVSGGFQNTSQYNLWVDNFGNGVVTPNQSWSWDIAIQK